MYRTRIVAPFDGPVAEGHSGEVHSVVAPAMKRRRKAASWTLVRRFSRGLAFVSNHTTFEEAFAFSLDILKEDGEDRLSKSSEARYNKGSGCLCQTYPPPHTHTVLVVGGRAGECLG